MPALVDSDIVIDALRGSQQAKKLLIDATESGVELCISSLTVVEVLGGAQASEIESTNTAFDSFTCVSVSQEIAYRAAELARSYRRSHSGINLADYVIAATVLTLDADLLTRNVRHYPMFEGLSPAY